MKIYTEIGLNHMGENAYANHLLNKALKSDANGFSFQVRDINFYKKFKKYKLNDSFYLKAAKLAKKYNKEFGISIKDINRVSFFEDLDVSFYKIIENDLENYQLVERVLNSNAKKIIVSTGMTETKRLNKFFKYFQSNKNKKKIILLHTTLSEKINKVNLKSIPFLKDKFKTQVGYGNHCEDYRSIFLSLVLEPNILMFYIKGKKFKEHIDENYAIDLKNLNKFIVDIKKLEFALGKYQKIKIDDIKPEKNVKKIR